MTTPQSVVMWDDDMLRYDFGPSHPMAPVRLDLTMRLARELGVLDHLRVVPPPAVDLTEILAVHSQEYVAAVQHASAPDASSDIAHGLGTPDVPVFVGMHDASARVVAATVDAARRVWSGDCPHAFSIAGGLHHAMPSLASGFCVYNDVAAAIAWLLAQGVERVAYVDVDVHHGDGVEHIFWDDPRVLTISVHESPQTLFPGTGWDTDTGGPNAPGSAINVPLSAGTNDTQWLQAITTTVPDALAAFQPDVLVSQHGCDTHYLDPLAHLDITVDGQHTAAQLVHAWAHEFTNGRWVAAGGGGYALVDVVPRTWTHLMAILSEHPIDPQTPVPPEWRKHVRQRFGVDGPTLMTDGARFTLTRSGGVTTLALPED